MPVQPEIRILKTSQELFEAAAAEFASGCGSGARPGKIHGRALRRLDPEEPLFPVGNQAKYPLGQDLFFLG